LCAVFTSLGLGHDIAVKYISSKTVVPQGFCSSINAKVLNAGSYTESIIVMAYANSTIIASKSVTLDSGNFTLIDLRWNSTDLAKGNYDISVYASSVPGETNLANNGLSGISVFVSIVGDANGDRKVDLKDIFAVARAFSSYPGHARWSPNCDLDGNNKVDLRDYFSTCKNYGESW